jgi:hypothetical protein
MKGKQYRKTPTIDRRSFVYQTVRLAAWGSLLLPLIQACNNKKTTESATTIPGKDTRPPAPKTKKPRNTWSHEGLVMNTKTNTLHLPSSKVYRYYDEIKPVHLQVISIATWTTEVQEPLKIHKQQSGTILEILALLELRKGISDETLTKATQTVSKAFTASCENAKGFNLNSTNFRLHELLLQLVSLNNSIPASDKWNSFNSLVKKPATLRKRQFWMQSETAFNERVNYILNRQNDYLARLNQRAAKYTFN